MEDSLGRRRKVLHLETVLMAGQLGRLLRVVAAEVKKGERRSRDLVPVSRDGDRPMGEIPVGDVIAWVANDGDA